MKTKEEMKPVKKLKRDSKQTIAYLIRVCVKFVSI